MIEYLAYTTREGDRWDLIAFRMYGDAYKFEAIIAANSHVPIHPVLPGGLELRIPLLELVTVEASLLPPWKR